MLSKEQKKDEFWRTVIRSKLIEIPNKDGWITKRASYQHLAKKLNFRVRAPDMISVDHYEKLPNYLKELDCGVIRLGSYNSKNGTDFILCKPGKGGRSLYLFDNEVFRSASRTSPAKGTESIIALIQRMESLDEKSGLSIFNRIFPFKLVFKDLYEYDALSFPYKMNHTFRFFVEEGFEPVEHINGQIESDSNVVILSKLQNPTVVVIEAKFGSYNPSIAKHKLLYATMVARKLFGDAAEIIPAYLRVVDYGTVVRFNFCTLNISYEHNMPVLMSIAPTGAYLIEIERKGSLLSKQEDPSRYSIPIVEETKEEFG